MAPTVEDYRLALAEKVRYFKALKIKEEALANYERERIQNSTSPAALQAAC